MTIKSGNAETTPDASRRLRFVGLRLRGETWLLVGLFLYFGAFSLWPLGRLLARSLEPGAHGVFLGVLIDQWRSAQTRQALWHTLEASLLSTALSVALGAAMAFVVGLTNIRLKSAIVFMLLLPLLIPPQIIALSWLELTDPSSPILAPLGLAPAYGRPNPLYSLWGVALVMGVEHSTLVFLSVRAGLAGLPRDLVEAARVCGAKPLRTAVLIVAPLALPAVMAGGALAFVSAVGDFGAPATLGIPARFTVLTTLIYQRLNGFGPTALGEVAALCLILMALAAAGLAIRAALSARMKATVDRVGPRFEPFDLKGGRLWVEAAVWLVLIGVSALPLLALLATSFAPAVGAPLRADTATLDNYRFALFGDAAARRGLVDSLALAASAALICALAAVPLGYLMALRRDPFARGLALAAEAPYALPGAALAIGFVIAFLPPLPILGVSIYNTIWIILAAYLARFMTLALRPIVAGLEAIDPSLDEAGRVVGASAGRRLVAIVWPAIAPCAGAGALLVFMTAFHELTVSSLLWSTGHETIGVMIFLLQYEGNSPAASALAVVTVAITLAFAALVGLFGRRLPRGLAPWRD